ncbi:MAG: hypothetical protein NVSMB16_15240 [Acidimicrobiales bacterium]
MTADRGSQDHGSQDHGSQDHGSQDVSHNPTVAEAVARAKRVRFGAPGRCPECNEPGFLDYLDNRSGTAECSCKTCRLAWTFMRDTDGMSILVG